MDSEGILLKERTIPLFGTLGFFSFLSTSVELGNGDFHLKEGLHDRK